MAAIPLARPWARALARPIVAIPRGPTVPPGFTLLTDEDGNQITDADGNALTVEAY